MYRGTWGADFPDPETFGNLFTSSNGNNDTKWKNSTYDQLIDRAKGEQNPAKRAELYAQADTLLCTVEAPIAPVFSATQNIMIKPWVHGIAMNPLDLQFFQDVTIDQ
jgi:oligopeptide transport system substrate-binding protein